MAAGASDNAGFSALKQALTENKLDLGFYAEQ